MVDKVKFLLQVRRLVDFYARHRGFRIDVTRVHRTNKFYALVQARLPPSWGHFPRTRHMFDQDFSCMEPGEETAKSCACHKALAHLKDQIQRGIDIQQGRMYDINQDSDLTDDTDGRTKEGMPPFLPATSALALEPTEATYVCAHMHRHVIGGCP